MLNVRLLIKQLALLLGITGVLFTWNAGVLSVRPIKAADKEKVLFQKSSPFGMVTVKQRGKLRVLALGKKDQTIFDPSPALLVYTYTRLMAVALSAWPKKNARVLLIGLGGGSLVHYINKHYPGFQLDVVELNPVVRTAAERFFALPKSNRVFIEDGRKFVAKDGPAYDIIMLDAYDENYIPPSLLTLEFLASVKKRLSAEGMLIVNTWQSDRLSSHETATYLKLFPGLYDLRFPGKTDGNRILVSGRRVMPNVEFITRLRKFLGGQNATLFPTSILGGIKYITAPPRGGKIITDRNVRSILGY